ncbi:MAG: cyclic nucleotide-binding domain-containing protein [Candidatus Omnitrophica bacterium]|nr:cyclic nucleotide-binding domain-containing protein [Candidatus Omnitrophota bacterium]
MPQKVITDKTLLIKQISFFSDLEAGQIDFISKRSDFFEYKKGETIYREGDVPDAFYLIVSGRVRIFTEAAGGNVTLECLYRGSYFGIISLLTNESHSVSAEAVNDSIILKIGQENFHAVLNELPHLALHFSSVLARRLRRREKGRKNVFESTIISVYGPSNEAGSGDYAMALAAALYRETAKEVIFLDTANLPAIHDEEELKSAIIKFETGISVLKATAGAGTRLAERQTAWLLTYLAANFDYCIVGVPGQEAECAVATLVQSDTIHIVTGYSSENINSVNSLLDKLEGQFREPRKMIKFIVSEAAGRPANLPVLKYGIYATLPDPAKNSQEYNLAVRRVAREIGGVRVGIALGSGAAWSLSIIGVIKVLEREGVLIDVAAGSSMGGLIGAFWAAGYTGADMERIAIENKKQFGALSLKDLKFPIRGLLSDTKTMHFLRRYLGNRTFQEIKFPLRIVCSGLTDRKETIIASGSLVDAVRASISIPGVYSPVIHEGRIVIDGGILDPVPVSLLNRMNIKKIIAVNTIPSPEDVQKGLLIEKGKPASEPKGTISRLKKKILNFLKPNILEIIMDSIEALEYSTAEANCRQADVVIHPRIIGWSWKDFFNPEVLISLGEEACMAALPEIKKLIAE